MCIEAVMQTVHFSPKSSWNLEIAGRREKNGGWTVHFFFCRHISTVFLFFFSGCSHYLCVALNSIWSVKMEIIMIAIERLWKIQKEYGAVETNYRGNRKSNWNTDKVVQSKFQLSIDNHMVQAWVDYVWVQHIQQYVLVFIPRPANVSIQFRIGCIL